MKKLILILLLSPAVIFTQWVQQYPPAGIDLILSIDFANTNFGAAGGWGGGFVGKAIYTTNSGSNWFLAQVPDSSRSLVKVQMIDANTGYIVGAYNIFKKNGYQNFAQEKKSPERKSASELMNYYERIGMTGNSEEYKGLFLKTTNGGKNWFTHGTLPSNVYYLLGMQFINVNTGFISASLDYSVGRKNAVLKTTNGGLNWFSIYNIDTADINNIYTSDGNTIFVSGWKSFAGDTTMGMILKTTNGGNLWNVQIFNEAEQISDVNFINSLTGFAVSSLGNIIIGPVIGSAIFKTTNAGINWLKLGSADTLLWYETVEFVPGTGKGFAAGYKISPEYLLESLLIRRTTNYGVNWTDYFIPDFNNILHGSSIADGNTWFAAGGIENALVYKTTNGGAPIGIEPISSEVPNQFQLSQNYPNPFNPLTKIKFSLPFPSEGGVYFVSLIVYDVLGKEVASLIPPLGGGQEGLKPGTYEVEWNGSNYSSGIYFYKLVVSGAEPLTAQDFSETKKMVLIK